MATSKVRCAQCRCKFEKENKEINRCLKQGRAHLCSLKCSAIFGNGKNHAGAARFVSRFAGRKGSDNLNWKGGISAVESQMRSRRKYPEHWKARKAVERALLRGDLVKPDKCQDCPSTGPIEAHHEDYSKPLEVIWCCRECHDKRDRKLKSLS